MRKLIIGSALAIASLTGQAQEITLKVAHFWPPQAMAPTKVLQPFCDKLAAESQNRLKCQIYPAMQLGGSPPQLITQAADGVADIVFTVPGYTPGRFPVMEVFELPFMISTAEQAGRAAWDYYLKYGQKEWAAVKPLMFVLHDPGYLHTKSKQIKTLEDLKGLKLRAPSRFTNKLLGSLGATPIGMPVSQVPEALSKSVVDGAILPWEVVPAFKIQELVKFHTETDPKMPALYSAMLTIAMNKARYESLPADLKAVIDRNSGAALSAAAGRIWDESVIEGRKTGQARGNTFHTIPEAELRRWIKASAAVEDEWVDGVTKAGMPGKQMLQDARELLIKHAK